jgi:putative ABC transport system permease protein
VVSALKNTLSTNFASMGSNTFNITQYETSTRRRGGGVIDNRNIRCRC